MQAASTTTEQKRPNTINSSPAEIPTQILRAEPSINAPGPLHPAPLAPRFVIPGLMPGFLSWPGLLLERTERQRNQDEPERLPQALREISGGTHGNAGIARPPQCRTTGLMRSERSHESRTCRLRQSLSLLSPASCRTRSRR